VDDVLRPALRPLAVVVPPVSHQLAKALVINTTTGDAVPVMYNPSELTLEQGNSFAEIAIPGLDASPAHYVRGNTRTLSMELFFDSYEAGSDVRAHTSRIVRLLDKSPQAQAPPVLLFSMGRFQFRCVLVDAGQRFTMFLPDGTPVRSTMTVRFREHVAVELQIDRGFFLSSPTVSAAVNTVAGTVAAATRGQIAAGSVVHVVVRGDTLSGLAGVFLGDPARWREIADANGVQDPLDLAPGRPLVIPGASNGTAGPAR
jgi:Contractile injection system tube protein/LysM domain